MENISEEKPAVSQKEGKDSPIAAGYRTASGITIDFHSAEFNQPDDLSDLGGNYRTFQPLDGVVTADMLHQTERRGRTAEAAISDTPAAKSAVKSNDRPEKEDEESAAGLPVHLSSRGRILIIDTDAKGAAEWGKALSARGMECTAVVTQAKASGPSGSRAAGFPVRQVPGLSVSGFFGNFSARTSADGQGNPPAEWPSAQPTVFDLVLDLQPAASYAQRLLPLGYYAPGPNPDHLENLLEELPRMRGQFQKPQFTALRQSRCLHHVSSKTSCQLCLDACPLSAIGSIKGKLVFNHHLCEGCGVCALVCPTDAVSLVHPSPPERLVALRQAVMNRPAGSHAAPTLIISDDSNRGPARAEDEEGFKHEIHFAVDHIGHIGAETLLFALAYGAGKVVVACDPGNDKAVLEAVRRQAEMGRALLRGLGQPEDLIRFRSETGLDREPAITPAEIHRNPPEDEPGLSAAALASSSDRRTLIRLAVRELRNRLPAQQTVLPLPEGSPFGAVSIDPACTLCMACVEACPAKALRAGGGSPKLEFIESRCHQCGVCKDLCPEKAVRLTPRMLCDPEEAQTPVVLHEVQAARCIECGAPFASQAMVSRMRTTLTGHWMYASEKQLRRLQMCRICRTQDALKSEDLKIWNPSHVR